MVEGEIVGVLDMGWCLTFRATTPVVGENAVRVVSEMGLGTEAGIGIGITGAEGRGLLVPGIAIGTNGIAVTVIMTDEEGMTIGGVGPTISIY